MGLGWEWVWVFVAFLNSPCVSEEAPPYTNTSGDRLIVLHTHSTLTLCVLQAVEVEHTDVGKHLDDGVEAKVERVFVFLMIHEFLISSPTLIDIL